MKIYRVVIQDGENTYAEWTQQKPNADYVDGFMRAVKDIAEFKITKEELKVLEKFGII